MTDGERQLVRLSSDALRERLSESADLFYERIAEIDPDSIGSFPAEAPARQAKFAAMVDLLAESAESWESAKELRAAAALSHAELGIDAESYRTAGEAFVWAIRAALGEDGSPEVGSAWRQVYVDVANEMICGSSSAPA